VWRDTKAASSQVSDPALKRSLEGLNTNLSGIVVGRLVYFGETNQRQEIVDHLERDAA